ncbi:MAG TPA: peptidoglycan DD-metalloendopeptidase family protein [Rhodocyclaceae bacterium]
MVKRFFLLALLPLAAQAASADSKKAELKETQARIEALRHDLAKSEESRASASDQLRDTESAISGANRRLRELADSRSEIAHDIAGLDQQSAQLTRQIEAQQKQLGKLLRRQFIRGNEADALQLLLSGEEPDRIARDQYFLKQLSRAQARMLEKLRGDLQEKQRLADARRDKAAELAAIEKQQQDSRAALLAKQRERQTVLAKIADKIKSQRKEIDTLKGNEKRLTKLIEGLARIVPSKPSRAKSRDLERGPAAAPAREADVSRADGAFATLKGRLRLPLSGQIAARFGSARAEGGSTWKGIFIRAAEGTDVHAVAAGTVVFSDWLRGFGNLLIVDHGDGFLSIYGNNQSLLREAGQSVKGGESVATAGNSGGNPESGLYFELRYRGQPFDPLKWAAAR